MKIRGRTMHVTMLITVAKVDGEDIVSINETYEGLFDVLDSLHGIVRMATPDGVMHEILCADDLYELLEHRSHSNTGIDTHEWSGESKLASFDLIGENDDRIVKVYVR